MPSNSWNPWRPSQKRLYDEEKDSTSTERVPLGPHKISLHISTARHPRPRHTKHKQSTIVNSFHRDAFSTRLPAYYEALPGADGVIRFGHKIALKQVRSGRFLHADKEHTVKENGELAASIHTWKPREVDYWIVLPQLGQTQQMGKPIRLNRTIRLQHITTRAHLHTHSTNSASSTGLGGLPEYEISLLPDIRSDSNDVWIVEVFNFSRKPTASGGDADVEDISPALNHDTLESADFWHVDNVVAFRHKVTGHRLAGRATQPLDKEAGLAKVVAAKRCEIESAWRVVVPKEDEDVIQMSASMEEVNTLDRFTVEQVGEMESSLINVEMIK